MAFKEQYSSLAKARCNKTYGYTEKKNFTSVHSFITWSLKKAAQFVFRDDSTNVFFIYILIGRLSKLTENKLINKDNGMKFKFSVDLLNAVTHREYVEKNSC